MVTGPPPLSRLAPRVQAESGWSLVSLLVTSDNARRVSGEMAFIPFTSPLRSLMGAVGRCQAARNHPAPLCVDASVCSILSSVLARHRTSRHFSTALYLTLLHLVRETKRECL